MSTIDTETRRKLREMAAGPLLDALLAQDEVLTMGMSFEERIQLAVDEVHSAFTHAKVDGVIRRCVCDQLLVGQLSREIRPVQRLVSGQKSAKNPTTSPQAVLVGGVDQLITRVMGGAYCRVRYGDGYRLSCKSS